jgi:hypothetical protein
MADNTHTTPVLGVNEAATARYAAELNRCIWCFLTKFPFLEQQNPALLSHRSILLPLWSENPDIHTAQQHFNEYKRLLDFIKPLLVLAGTAMKISSPNPQATAEIPHERALNAYRAYIANPDLLFPAMFPAGKVEDYNCFNTMRLNAKREVGHAGGRNRVTVVAFVGPAADHVRVYLCSRMISAEL